jgi:hypothetical protein
VIVWTPEQEAVERARLAALGAELGVEADEVTPAVLEAAASAIGCAWTDIDATKVVAKRAQVRDAVAVAVAVATLALNDSPPKEK